MDHFKLLTFWTAVLNWVPFHTGIYGIHICPLPMISFRFPQQVLQASITCNQGAAVASVFNWKSYPEQLEEWKDFYLHLDSCGYCLLSFGVDLSSSFPCSWLPLQKMVRWIITGNKRSRIIFCPYNHVYQLTLMSTTCPHCGVATLANFRLWT